MSACRIHVTRAPRHQHSIISRIYQTPIRGYVICRAAPSDEPGALREALELFNQSRELATLQTRAELINAFVADGEAEVARIDGNPAALRRAIAGYLVELGLTQTASEKLAKDLQEAGKVASLEQLAARVSRLQRVLPEADIGAMVAKDSAILDVDSRLAIRNMVVLVEAFPGVLGLWGGRRERQLPTRPRLRPRGLPTHVDSLLTTTRTLPEGTWHSCNTLYPG